MKNLDDLELEREALHCVQSEHEKMIDVLRYLCELERRKIALKRGSPSLFAYCREQYQYSEQQANVRIRAARLMRRVEGVEGRLRRGTLTLCVASLIYGVVKSKKLAKEEASELVAALSGMSNREARQELARRYPEPLRPERKRFVDGENIEVRFTLNAEETAVVEQALDLHAHSNFGRSLKELLLLLARDAIKKHEKKPAQDTPLRRTARKRNRHIPKVVKAQVWERDEGKCQYQDPLTGKKCGAKHGLQMDHIKPYAQGGLHTPENLRLYCGAHNRARE